jgi:flagellar basal body-associated protein FliL
MIWIILLSLLAVFFAALGYAAVLLGARADEEIEKVFHHETGR